MITANVEENGPSGWLWEILVNDEIVASGDATTRAEAWEKVVNDLKGLGLW